MGVSVSVWVCGLGECVGWVCEWVCEYECVGLYVGCVCVGGGLGVYVCGCVGLWVGCVGWVLSERVCECVDV